MKSYPGLRSGVDPKKPPVLAGFDEFAARRIGEALILNIRLTTRHIGIDSAVNN